MPINIMCSLLLFTNLQTHSAHRSYVDFTILETPCGMRSTKCVAYFDLSRYKGFPDMDYHISCLCGTYPLVFFFNVLLTVHLSNM